MIRFPAKSDFRVNTLIAPLCGVFCFAAALAISPHTAIGQTDDVTGPPTGITPPSDGPTLDDTADGSPLRSITDRPGLSDGGIQVGNLSGVDASGLGLIGPQNGGFEQNLWQGSERLVIETLMPKLPVATNSTTMNQLARRLLLTAGPLPEGVTRGPSFLALRLERLYAAGRVAELVDLANMGTTVPKPEYQARYQAQGHLLSGDYVNACNVASSAVEGRSEAFWLRLRTFCFAIAGENAAADLTADLLREQNIDDPRFYGLVTRMTTGADIEISQEGDFDAVSLAMHAQLGISPAENMIAGLGASELVAIAQDERFDLETRLSAAQMAAKFGALPADRLGELYDQVEFSADELSNALTLVGEIPASRGQALIYRMLKTLTVPSAFAEALRAATGLAIENGAYSTAAELYWPILRGLTPAEPYAEVAADIGRMALLNGDSENAYSWYDTARLNNRALPAGTRDLRILLAVGAPSDRLAWRSSDPMQWLSTLRPEAPEYFRLVRNIQLMEGLGFPVSRDSHLKMLEAPLQRQATQTSPVVLSRLGSATVANRLGEVVLLSLITIGGGGPNAASLPDLLEAYGSLSSVGLKAEAKQIALEAVLASQLDAQRREIQ